MRNAAKVLHFPFAGLSRSLSVRDNTQPSETRTYATPLALNVRGTCVFADRQRGGSRPGLALVSVSAEPSGKWLWPNGEPVLWPGGASILLSELRATYATPDGSRVLDPHAAVRISAAVGNAPSSPSVISFYRARAFAADGTSWFASATGDATDWDYGGDRDNPARAVAGNLALAGRKGEPITAFMAVDDSRLFAATARSLWAMTEPTAGMAKVSDSVGCVSADAWCVANGVLYTLCSQGLYRVAPGEMPMRVDAEIPEELRGASAALLGYDPKEDAIHIFSDKGNFFYEIGNKAFWPVSVPARCRPTAVARCFIDNIERVVLRGADGQWYRFSDDVPPEASYVAIGPFRTSGRDYEDGILDTIHAVLASASTPVSLEIYPARTAEAALEKAVAATPVFTAFVGPGFNHTLRPRVRGAWCVIVLRGTSAAWAYETMTVNCKQLGRLR